MLILPVMASQQQQNASVSKVIELEAGPSAVNHAVSTTAACKLFKKQLLS